MGGAAAEKPKNRRYSSLPRAKTQSWTLCPKTAQRPSLVRLGSRRHSLCFHVAMLSRIARFDFSMWEMVALSVLFGLLAATRVALQVG